MGTKYTSQTPTGYNSSPPPDDGSTTEANKTKWSTIKTKLSDPLNTWAANIDSALTTHFNRGPTAISTATTLDATHYQKVIEASGTSEITLTDAATLTAGWFVDIINVGSGNVPILRATASDTIDEVSADITLFPLDAIRVSVNTGASGFVTQKRGTKFNKGSDVASATALAVPNDGNYFDVTGTTTITSINSIGIGAVIKLHFDGAVTITHNATTLVLPNGANLTTTAGDELEFFEYAAGDWRLTNYSGPGRIAALTADSAPNQGADYVETYDASAGVNKKVLLNNLGAARAVVTDTTDVSVLATDTDCFSLGTFTIPTDGIIKIIFNGRWLDTSGGNNSLHLGVKVNGVYYYPTISDNGTAYTLTPIKADPSQYRENAGTGLDAVSYISGASEITIPISVSGMATGSQAITLAAKGDGTGTIKGTTTTTTVYFSVESYV